MSPVRQFFHQKWVRIVLILDLLAIIAVIVVAIVNTGKTSVVTFNIAPVDAFIKMGDTYYNNGTYQVSPGSYDVRISHEGLNTKTIRVDLAPNSTTNVTAFLSGTKDGQPSYEFYEQKDNYDSYQLLASIASADNNRTIDHDTSAELFIAEYQEQYNLYYSSVIPINYQTFTTDSAGEPLLDKSITIKRAGNNAGCKKLLCLQALMINRDSNPIADALLEEKGFNLDYLEVYYETF